MIFMPLIQAMDIDAGYHSLRGMLLIKTTGSFLALKSPLNGGLSETNGMAYLLSAHLVI